MKTLFEPRGVAFVGATPDTEKYNGRVLKYAIDSGFAGHIWPVNPKYDTIFGLPCHSDLSSVPGPVDVVVILVGPARIPELMRQCADKGVDYAIALGDLIAPDSADRQADERRLRGLLADGGPRIVGPVCVGVIRPGNNLSMTMSSGVLAGPAPKGNIGLVSQSGGVLSSALDRSHQFGGGFSTLVSSGAEWDLNLADYVEYLLDDPETDCIAAYAEKLVDPQRLFRLADRARERDKPFLLLKGGSSERGALSALTHSGAIAGDLALENAAFRRHGIVRVHDVDDLLMTARVLADHRVTPDRGVAAVSQSGGYCTIVADALSRAGVPIADPEPATVDRILAETPVPRVGNPHDSASGPPGNNAPHSRASLLAFQDDPNVGATLYAETMYMYQAEGHKLQRDVSAYNEKPHLVCWQGGKATESVIRSLRSDGVIVFDTLTAATSALAGLYHHADLMRRPLPRTPQPMPLAVTLPDEGGLLDDATAKSLLRKFDIPLVEELFASDPATAAAQAGVLGYPVVLKGVAAGVAHKSEAGMVRVGLGDAEAVEAAGRDMAAGVTGLAGFGVQRMAKGVELLLGVKNDRGLGPAVILGFGGLYAEAMRPPHIELAPIDPERADEMIDAVDPKGILSGYRTGKVLDRTALRHAITALSQLAVAGRDRIESIDLNPVIVGESTAVAVDAVVALWPATASMMEGNR